MKLLAQNMLYLYVHEENLSFKFNYETKEFLAEKRSNAFI